MKGVIFALLPLTVFRLLEENGFKSLSLTIAKKGFREMDFGVAKNYKLTIDRCHTTVGIAILNTSITIVFGFSILVLSNFIPTIYFGIFTGIAMLLALISVLTLLPKLILILKPFGDG